MEFLFGNPHIVDIGKIRKKKPEDNSRRGRVPLPKL